jgi:hypothetical protein
MTIHVQPGRRTFLLRIETSFHALESTGGDRHRPDLAPEKTAKTFAAHSIVKFSDNGMYAA